MKRLMWHIDGSAPLYLQLASSLRYSIVSGERPAGSRIESVRDLAADAKVNPNTMQRALVELEREGLIETRTTTGRFVTDDASIIERTRRDALDELIAEFTVRLHAIGCGSDEAAKHIKELADGEGAVGVGADGGTAE